MASLIFSDGSSYVSPEVKQNLLDIEGVLCLSVPSGDVDSNGTDNLLPGEDWGGSL
jgi:hypothetical protein